MVPIDVSISCERSVVHESVSGQVIFSVDERRNLAWDSVYFFDVVALQSMFLL
jgi:hypothetical protein